MSDCSETELGRVLGGEAVERLKNQLALCTIHSGCVPFRGPNPSKVYIYISGLKAP